MNEPDFSTAYTSSNLAPTDGPQPVESASASTACQTNSSRFAYVLTFGILGVISLIIIAISLLLFAAFTTYTTEAQNIDVYSWDYESGADSHEYFDDYGWYGLSANSHML